ncbi:SDR family oxidoreductase [Alteriqipengyuania sp. WL0013]|uniref:SDR family oxidoreductase n=1 Tax=Alteriqipengyuania sp. WL0013 TaxID=3110773 RepID=UPI002CAD9454|nr:SDR family oxidoreductase [Alteriqipengyuania sp. WL0013]MEB3414450.1 SDR family oxidoreductase [Alteriqipengyuania sp. WL0013]
MKILMTGAAGLLGGETAARLVARGHTVTALVHRNREVLANDGSPVAIADAIACDIAEPLLGLDEALAGRLAASHDMLVHVAATTRFDLPDEEYDRTNRGGAANAVALARLGGMRLLHVSTAYVCGDRNGRVAEGDPLPENGFANGYEASKAAAERLVRESGLDWIIARPSIVTGDSATGAIRHFDTIYAAFKLIAEGRVKHMEARRGATLDFVPIDHVCGALADLAENFDTAKNAAYHLVSGQPVPVETFASAIGAFPQFSAPDLVDPADFDPAALPALERRLYRRVAGLYASYFQRDPRFDDARLRAVTGRTCPPTGAAYLQRLIEFCIAEGFLPAA